MNSTALIGRICRDIEIKDIGGVQCVNNTLAVERAFKDKQGNKVTDFIPITLWRSKAELAGKYLHKGSKIAVTGEIQVRQYETAKGEKRTGFSINVESLYFLDSNKDNVKESIGEPANENEMPF